MLEWFHALQMGFIWRSLSDSINVCQKVPPSKDWLKSGMVIVYSANCNDKESLWVFIHLFLIDTENLFAYWSVSTLQWVSTAAGAFWVSPEFIFSFLFLYVISFF